MAWARESRRRGELPRDWPRIRASVLERDGGACVMCGAPATDVDHVDPSGPHEAGNLRSLCRTCHMRRTAAQSHAARRRRRRGQRRRFRPESKHPGIL